MSLIVSALLFEKIRWDIDSKFWDNASDDINVILTLVLLLLIENHISWLNNKQWTPNVHHEAEKRQKLVNSFHIH